MNRGDMVELIEDTAFYKKGKKAHFIRMSRNPNKAEIVWCGEEKMFDEFGDVEVMPLKMLRKVDKE